MSLAFREFKSIPVDIAKAKNAAMIKKVDLTETNIEDFSNLKYFTCLEMLVLDKNSLEVISESCPELPRVHTLWCNNNSIRRLSRFLNQVKSKFPSLRYLSLMRNPVSEYSEKNVAGVVDMDEAAKYYRKYRLSVIKKIPQLAV